MSYLLLLALVCCSCRQVFDLAINGAYRTGRAGVLRVLIAVILIIVGLSECQLDDRMKYVASDAAA
jgi:hypothetical protein